MTPASTETSPAFSALLLKKIRTLSKDTKFHAFPPDDGKENLEMMERKRAERNYQRALCERIWWNLSPKERSQMRAAVLKTGSFYEKDKNSEMVEWECLSEMRRILENLSGAPHSIETH